MFLDDPLSLRFAGLFARAKPAVGWFASVLFRVHHHVSRFSLCRLQCVSLREELNDQQQGFYRGLPRIKILFGLRKLHDVVGGIAQSHELAPTR